MAFETMEGQAGLPRWSETVFAVVRKFDTGTLSFSLPDGRTFVHRGERPGPEGHFDIREPRLFGRLMRDGRLGFGEAYMDGWWDSPDLQSLLDVLVINLDRQTWHFPGAAIVRAVERFRHWLRANTRRGSRRNIAYHYDLGNDFYSAWLDPSMTYSSALFDNDNQSLEAAQTAKYASICDRMELAPDARVLEIGCGWGGFAEYAIRERGAHVTGLTLSREQHDFARRRLFEAGLAERADIQLRDYRDEQGRYDRIASIEMFEAVGERYWPTYFKAIHDRLQPGGAASIQMITIADRFFEGYRRSTDFIQKYIFPGGMLASHEAARKVAETAGLVFDGSVEFGQSYSRTLRAWYRTFNERWEEISTMGFDERFRRMWNFYLAGCASSFLSGTTDVTQMTLRRPA